MGANTKEVLEKNGISKEQMFARLNAAAEAKWRAALEAQKAAEKATAAENELKGMMEFFGVSTWKGTRI